MDDVIVGEGGGESASAQGGGQVTGGDQAAGSVSQAGGGMEGMSGGQGAAPEVTMADVLKQIQALQSGMGTLQSGFGRVGKMQQQLEQMPKQFETAMEKRLRESSENQILASLAPEQRKQYEEQRAERERQTQELQRIIDSRFKELNPNGIDQETMAVLNEVKDQRTASKFFESIREALGDEDMQRINPVIGEMLKKHQDALNSGDPSQVKWAIDWMKTALARPEKVALDALRTLQGRTGEQANQVVNQRLDRGRSLSLGGRGGSGGPRGGSQNLKGMNQKQLDELAASMPTADFEKLVNAQK